MLQAPVLTVSDLSVGFRVDKRMIPVVRNVSFSVAAGETLALVGESGSGKSVTSLAMLRLTPPPPRTLIEGRVSLKGDDGRETDLLAMPAEAIRDVRGNDVAMIFQEPMSSLNPVYPIGRQISEAILFHRRMTRREALERTVELLDLVGIPDPRRRLGSYPHQLSGGMRQRVMIAMALSCEPKVLIADEPTTALDVTVQAQILELLKELQARTGMAIIFITHNMGVVAEVADRVMVMYAGRIVETGDVRAIFRRPLMPYTVGLLNSVPRMDMAGRRDVQLQAISGSVPQPSDLPPGCTFHPRCRFAERPRCTAALPPLEEGAPGHEVRCVRWREIADGGAAR